MSAIAGLVRHIIHARRGLSRTEVVNWVARFIHDTDPTKTSARVGSVIDTLCELKDIGYGKVLGEPVLVALPERRIALPDGTVVALGDHRAPVGPESERLIPEVAEGATMSLVELLASFDEPRSLSGLSAIESVGHWTGDVPMPTQLRRALSLLGSFDPLEQKWSISEENAAFLNEWFGLTRTDPLDREEVPDESQLRVAQEPAQRKMFVEAGPGSGKTHTACERVISLVREKDVAPSRILLLSFTRIAVAELRNRIDRQLEDMKISSDVQIRTFDSFAAHLLANLGKPSSGGHDACIQAASSLMRSDDPFVEDAISQLEHVIIDEAQDLIGVRKEMCEALLAMLAPECGVTIFGDFAQSIFSYRRKRPTDTTLLEDVAKRSEFLCRQLERDHRTGSDALKEMFVSVRRDLGDDLAGSREGYFRVRERIRDTAVERDIRDFAVHPSTTGGLILARSRRGLFTAAEEMRAAGRKFRIRLPDRPLRIEGWIGALLGGQKTETRLSRDDFQAGFNALRPAPSRDPDACWKILLELDASDRDHVTIGRVAEGLEDPPLELLSDHEGRSGPMLSTIHAVKGSEAEQVMLLLTPARNEDHVDWADEARVLYVGATRARRELRTGWINRKTIFPIGDPQRHWAPHADHRLIEIGLEGDLVDWAGFMRSGHVANEANAISRIWLASHENTKTAAYPDADVHLVLRIDGPEGFAIGCLSDEFVMLTQSMRQVEPDSALPEVVSDISIVGATTVVVPARADEAPGLALMPLLGGFASVPR